jgi:hypothetical protein
MIFAGLYELKATDPKDKVFGIFGILKSLNVELPHPAYNRSVKEIYTETMPVIYKAT